jgi:hypothetical protein
VVPPVGYVFGPTLINELGEGMQGRVRQNLRIIKGPISALQGILEV